MLFSITVTLLHHFASLCITLRSRKWLCASGAEFFAWWLDGLARISGSAAQCQGPFESKPSAGSSQAAYGQLVMAADSTALLGELATVDTRKQF